MNLRVFSETVDEKAREMSREELQLLLHSLARKIPENCRQEFIGIMEQARRDRVNAGTGFDVDSAARKRDQDEIRQQLAELIKQFKMVEEGEVMLLANGYEDYSSGYWDSDWVYEYEDPEGIGRIYEQADSLLQRCVSDGFYKEAAEVFELMTETEATADDGGDCLELDLREMEREGLVSVDCERLTANGLYAVYQSTESGKRAEELYSYVTTDFCRDARLEDMLSIGMEEPEGLADFWKSWIALLLEKDGDTAGRYLEEAVLYQCTEEEMAETARKAGVRHPALYLGVIKRLSESSASRALEAGKAAMEIIDVKYAVRGEIALAAAEAAVGVEERGLAECFWIEAFRSDTTPVNYLRIAAECAAPGQYREEMERIIRECRKYSNLSSDGGFTGNRHISARELRINTVSEAELDTLHFLNGDFDAAMKKIAAVKRGLGWSGSFIKRGIPLFLLLLLQGENPPEGCRSMFWTAANEMGFRKQDYETGLKAEDGKAVPTDGCEDENAFRSVFFRWRKQHVLAEEQAQEYLVQLERLIDIRVRAIVGGQHRGHYGSVAALAAALGEVKESRGEPCAKSRILLEYRAAFPRHNSFHAELRSYGMPDTRKNRR